MRFGTIGTSKITEKFMNASEYVSDLNLNAVYSRSLEKAKAFGQQYGTDNYFTSIEDMAKSQVIDCVYIASPNSLHYEQTILFLQQGKHVICEKPIFSNTAELEKAYDEAYKHGVYLFEAIRNIHTPNFEQIKQNLTKLGLVRSALLQRVRYSSRYDLLLQGEKPNIFSSELSGGALVDVGIYPLYLAVTLFGNPEKALYFPVKLSTGVDGSGTLVLIYHDFVCTVLCSKMSTSYNENEIQGEEGTLVIDNVAPISDVRKVSKSPDSPVEHVAVTESQNDMVYEIRAFLNVINTGDDIKYKELQKISRIVLSITEEARKQNGIQFQSD